MPLASGNEPPDAATTGRRRGVQRRTSRVWADADNISGNISSTIDRTTGRGCTAGDLPQANHRSQKRTLMPAIRGFVPRLINSLSATDCGGSERHDHADDPRLPIAIFLHLVGPVTAGAGRSQNNGSANARTRRGHCVPFRSRRRHVPSTKHPPARRSEIGAIPAAGDGQSRQQGCQLSSDLFSLRVLMDRNGPAALGDSPISQPSASRPENAGPPAERVTGIEPALSAWEADVLPLNYTRRRSNPTRRSAVNWLRRFGR